MSRDTSVAELLSLLESSDLQQLEQVKAAINDQLNTDRGGAVLSSLIDYYLDSSSPQAALLLSSVREPLDKPLLERLNECLVKPGSRLASLSLLGYVVRRQPPWIHKISTLPLLNSLLRCLKTDGDVVVLVTGVLVLITLLPMIPQAGKQHIYDFFDVFGRLASWSLKNPGHVYGVYLVHLHASVYSLFHRLYGMYPCNFISYLRLHYSMKENLDTFQEVVKPMLEHVRVHPELVTGTQDSELDPSRWRCYEIHDIVIECAKVSLDPRESSCEEGYSSLPDLLSSRPPLFSHPDHTSSLHIHMGSSIGNSACTQSTGHSSLSLSLPQLAGHSPYFQCEGDDVTWSPSSECGLATPPASRGMSPANVPEPSLGSSQSPSRTASISGVKCPSTATSPVGPSTTLAEVYQHGGLAPHNTTQTKQQPVAELEGPARQPITEKKRGQPETFSNNKEVITEELLKLAVPQSSSPFQPLPLASTPSHAEPPLDPGHQPLPWSFRPSFTPIRALLAGAGPSLDPGPVPPYQPLFQLALPNTAVHFVEKKNQEVVGRAGGEAEKEGAGEREEEGEECSSLSPLEVLDRLILHGHEAHDHLSRRLPMPNKSVDWSHFGGKPQSMKAKGSTQGEELQALRSQLLLVHSQLQYERYKRQQHALRNRRLLRRIINTTALEEHNVSMRAQLGLQEVEIQSLRSSLLAEQQRYTELSDDTHTHTTRLHTQIQHLQQQEHQHYTRAQNLQSELQECQSRLGDLEEELQKANNEAYNAEHQLTQLSLKLASSEELQHQMYLLNKQLLLLGETNRLLTDRIHTPQHSKEISMLQCIMGREQQTLRESEAQQTQRLEAANHRLAELEGLLARKEQLILDQKKLLEETKDHAKAELSASEGRYIALKRVTQALHNDMLQLYSQIDLDAHTHTHTQPQPTSSLAQGPTRPNGGGVVMPTMQGSCSLGNKPFSSFSIINGSLEPLSTSALHLLSSSPLSLSPIDSPLAVGSCPTQGSFLEQRARQLFRPPAHSQAGEEEQEQEQEEEGKEEEELGEEEEEVAQVGDLSVGQEVHDAGSLQSSSKLKIEPLSLPARVPRPPAPLPGPPAQGPRPPAQGPAPVPAPGPPSHGPAPVPGPPATAPVPRPSAQGPVPGPPAQGPGAPVLRQPPPERGPRDLTQALRQRREELSIMDYDQTLPEY
ncbi:TSC complex subunit 1a isoform 2-T2 [Polymixia lowei]